MANDFSKKCNLGDEAYINFIKTGEVKDSYNITLLTLKLLRKHIFNTEWKTAKDLINILRDHIKKLNENLPIEVSAANMVRRVLKIVRDEYYLSKSNSQREPDLDQPDSLHKIVSGERDDEDFSIEIPKLKKDILAHINDLEIELESSTENIASQCKENIHSNEVILTYGRSRLVKAYLIKASAYRQFEVMVVESAPNFHGQELAASLAKHNIQTTVIMDTAVFCLMSRVNKVIIGTHTVMANGGLRAVSGMNLIAVSAKRYSVPVIVLAPLYKFTPHFLTSNVDAKFNVFKSPNGVLSYAAGDILSKVQVYNPTYDYVAPELVELIISNTGGHSVSYLYKLLKELYHPEDYYL